jgi:hypothetical protein
MRSCEVVEVQHLRRMLTTSVVARRLGLNRKTFGKQAKRNGVIPDHVSSGSRLREFYDETRIEDIRARLATSGRLSPFPPGSLVLDRGRLASVDFTDSRDWLHLRYIDASDPAQPVHPAGVRKLVSVRELARSERMSRYKLSRLLTASGVRPVHRGGKTIYFDANEAGHAVRERLARESSAVTLDVLADRTGVSAAVLARKVRQGCIFTTGQANHAVDASEADRISEVVRSLRSPTQSIEALGICRLHSRGRSGEEVAAWDIAQLIKVAEPMTAPARRRLYGQVAWLCEGAGRRRFVDSMQKYLRSPNVPGLQGKPIGRTETLLELFDHLPAALSCCRRLAALLASGTYSQRVTNAMRNLAGEADLDSSTSHARLRAQIDDSVANLLTLEGIQPVLRPNGGSTDGNASLYPEDDFVEGAVILCNNGLQAEVGFIVRVEQRAWNSVAGVWDKTVVVRFAAGERRMNPHTRIKNEHESKPRVRVLLRTNETLSVLRTIGPNLEYAA